MNLLPPITKTRHTDIQPLLNTVFCMDALDLLAALPDSSVDMVLCDLPYQKTQATWDIMLPLDEMWNQLKRVIKDTSAIVLTSMQPFTSILTVSNLPMFQYQWVWQKTRKTNFLNAKKMPLNGHEDILVFGTQKPNYYPQMTASDGHTSGAKHHRGTVLYGDFSGDYYEARSEYYPCTVIKFAHDPQLSVTHSHRPNKLPTHPTQKPSALFEYLIKTYTREHEIVLDMTAGSGTTAIAAVKTNRQYIINDNGRDDRTGRLWSDIAQERIITTDPYQDTVLADGTKQLSLFGDIA